MSCGCASRGRAVEPVATLVNLPTTDGGSVEVHRRDLEREGRACRAPRRIVGLDPDATRLLLSIRVGSRVLLESVYLGFSVPEHVIPCSIELPADWETLTITYADAGGSYPRDARCNVLFAWE